MGMLLAYELEKGTERELKSLAAALGHQVKMVSSSNYGEPPVSYTHLTLPTT